ncbi:MAG: efflux RND transporter periplasmic adaptor subunit [candidate division Zixibacteria bacterium]|nr:efflux RND transporter periplasmic adaptor subunit [candidate division Zixibacteria bacterium]MDH3938791.1 efflux RND transporter periplasmic adaptor subunit [candidate division Zixibacteria bacterium]MDH4032344.1 efflux RND transporter periplasmic adaptor subunit [candidate division Zixibacteria bacterium]
MKKYVYGAIVLVIVLGGYYGVNAVFSTSADIPTTRVTKGEFVISQKANGTVDAKRAYTLSAPRIRGLTITWLAPEGSTVEEGQPVIRFDASEQTAEVANFNSELKIKKSALERARKEYTIQEKQLTLELERSRRNYDEKKHDAPRIAKEAAMEKELAELNFDAKLDQLKGDVDKSEVEVQRAQDKRDQAQRELDQLTVMAPIPGLVVYLEIWKGSGMDKVQEGDSPWPGMGLVKLPDLSEMIVKTAVSEVDASKVDSAQEVEVRLDAVPEKEYSGIVAKKGTLARKKERGSNINVFDVEVAILDHDESLKPGMSSSCDIIIERLPDLVSVPLEAVFENEGQTVVYLRNKKKREIEVGRRNDVAIEVVSGLEGGEDICLLNPTLDEQGMPGDKATEPELNKGRMANGSRGGRKGGKGKGR